MTWIDHFSELSALPTEDQDILVSGAQLMELPSDTVVFAPGVPASNFLLLLDGAVRVQQTSSSGREIVLYRVSGGESCIMTTSCLLSDETYCAEGITETPVSAVAIPKSVFEDALARSPGFRRVVFSQYSQRLSDVMHVVEEVAFERLDKRLAERLLLLAPPDGTLSVTHQELATELGSAREAVGRLLKELERRGLVKLSRGQISIQDRSALKALADG